MSEEIKAWDEAWAEEFGNTNEGRKLPPSSRRYFVG